MTVGWKAAKTQNQCDGKRNSARPASSSRGRRPLPFLVAQKIPLHNRVPISYSPARSRSCDRRGMPRGCRAVPINAERHGNPGKGHRGGSGVRGGRAAGPRPFGLLGGGTRGGGSTRGGRG